MPITFAPIRVAKRGNSTDLTVQLRKNTSGTMALELSLSPAAQERIRYIDGDRVIAHFDESNKSWCLERISPDRSADGYKVRVHTLQAGGSNAVVRLGCTMDQVVAILGDKPGRGSYEFLEVAGNRATFVAAE
jgi:hypothetical protein